MKREYRLWLGSLAMVAACTSAPIHYHTLVPAPVDGGTAPRPSPYRVEIAAVKIPAQVDRPELVVRQRDGQIALLENEHWIAPLTDELRSALSIELARRLSVADAHDPVRDPGPMTVHIEIERFESAPGDYTLVEAFWRLRTSSIQDDVLACRSQAYERVPDGYSALVGAQQHAIASIADEIATAALRTIREHIAVCPAAAGSHSAAIRVRESSDNIKRR
jgi:uncharacterized lipoprotein YmbA